MERKQGRNARKFAENVTCNELAIHLPVVCAFSMVGGTIDMDVMAKMSCIHTLGGLAPAHPISTAYNIIGIETHNKVEGPNMRLVRYAPALEKYQISVCNIVSYKA